MSLEQGNSEARGLGPGGQGQERMWFQAGSQLQAAAQEGWAT